MSTCPHCGCDTAVPKTGKPRSVPAHRRYFALIRAAKMHWPEAHRFQPASEDHLRKWLQAKAGYRDVQTIDTDNMTPAQAVAAVAAVLSTADVHHFVHADQSRLYVITSRSIAFDALPHREACALFEAVAEVIESETGVRCDDMISTTPRKQGREPVVSEVVM